MQVTLTIHNADVDSMVEYADRREVQATVTYRGERASVVVLDGGDDDVRDTREAYGYGEGSVEVLP